jgi:hypothetical protein
MRLNASPCPAWGKKKSTGPVPPYYPQKQAEYLGQVNVYGGRNDGIKVTSSKEPPLLSAQQKLNFTYYCIDGVRLQTVFCIFIKKKKNV